MRCAMNPRGQIELADRRLQERRLFAIAFNQIDPSARPAP